MFEVESSDGNKNFFIREEASPFSKVKTMREITITITMKDLIDQQEAIQNNRFALLTNSQTNNDPITRI